MYASQVIILFLATFIGTSTPRATPCEPEDASQQKGHWSSGEDTTSDRRISSAERAAIHQKADRVIALLKQAIPEPTGVDARAYRTASGSTLVKDGALQFGATSLYLGYFCIPANASSSMRGQVVAGDETDTWIYIDFNSLGWLNNEGMRAPKGFQTDKGISLIWVPKQEGEVGGHPVFHTTLHNGRTEESIIVTADGKLPYEKITRGQYLRIRERLYAEELDRDQKNTWKSPDPNIQKKHARYVAELSDNRAKVAAMLESMSPEERDAIAFVDDPGAPPTKSMFATEAEGGRALATLAGRFFHAKGTRDVIRFVTVFWMWNPKDPAKSATVRRFKEHFNFKALEEMIGQ
jgi:hypothetical protein